jgi:hypothetical protein
VSAVTVIVSDYLAEIVHAMLVRLRRYLQGGRQWDTAEGPIVAVLATLLPAKSRERFRCEVMGNIGDCEHWWQRVDHLAGLVLGMPRLAWMMRRDGRRGRV